MGCCNSKEDTVYNIINKFTLNRNSTLISPLKTLDKIKNISVLMIKKQLINQINIIGANYYGNTSLSNQN